MGVISLLYLMQAFQLPAGQHWLNSSRTFPLLLGFGLLLLSILCIVQAYRQKQRGEKNETPITKAMLLRGLFFIVVTLIYLAVYPMIGFFPATFIYVVAMLLFYREIKWYTAFIVAGATLLFIHLIFERLLFLPLPT
ncbi:Tripartite tricarboxylate transporter TctB family protein [Alteribacillus iranensis]|uniref:Tripartite tricarboxylate transporter TctB family protein n=2 Tax=Alteribacillus iranensis TaxID=930128 RepID=A0A1I2BI16_9BACI|nr:Tripartite tricarboxylate transporter TctB family protein [Alteribacillus iranensis]